MLPPIANWVVLHAGALGDLILTIQLALRLPGVRGGAGLHLISRTDPGGFSGCAPPISRSSSETLSLHWLYCDPADKDPPPEALRAALSGRRVLSALAAPPDPLHQRMARLGPAALFGFDPRPRPETRAHITKQWAHDLAWQGLLLDHCTFRTRTGPILRVSDELRNHGREFLNSTSTPTGNGAPAPILIHPGSGGSTKCWPLANFVKVARALFAIGRPVQFLIGPVEWERLTTDHHAALAAEFPLITRPSPNDLVALLAAAAALIGNDSGPAHLAALVGTPTVSIFGPTDSLLWRPLGRRSAFIQGNPARDAKSWGIHTDDVLAILVRLSAD